MSAIDKAKQLLDELKDDSSYEALVLKMTLSTYCGAYHFGDLGNLSDLLLGFNLASLAQIEDYKTLEADEIL